MNLCDLRGEATLATNLETKKPHPEGPYIPLNLNTSCTQMCFVHLVWSPKPASLSPTRTISPGQIGSQTSGYIPNLKIDFDVSSYIHFCWFLLKIMTCRIVDHFSDARALATILDLSGCSLVAAHCTGEAMARSHARSGGDAAGSILGATHRSPS